MEARRRASEAPEKRLKEDGLRNRFRLRRRSGESSSHDILDARDMHYRAGELR